ncbi:MAG: PASTA domain-containing protein [Proteobacteria bacterium]|nr:PASTA domain-containing protein [Pseudomonadota bacterium]
MINDSKPTAALAWIWRMVAFIPRVLVPVFLITVTIYCGRAMGLAIYETYFVLPNEKKVPRITGTDVEEAKRLLARLNLGIDVHETRNSATVPKNAVIEQYPPADRDTREGSSVSVVVSLGPDSVTVPRLVEKTFEEAVVDLHNAKLNLGRVTRVAKHKDDPEMVLEQNPKPDATVKKGTKVNLMVNIGNDARVQVPSFVGQTVEKVRDSASWSNLKLGTLAWVVSDTVPAGTIVSQEPSAGKDVVPGAEVDMKVSLGASTGHSEIKQRQVQLRTPDVTGLQEIRVTVTDETGSHIAYEGTHAQGELVNVFVTCFGRGEYTVTANEKVVSRAKI